MFNRQGFTLVELMIVVVIIGILATIAIPNFKNMKGRAEESVVTSNAHTVQLAAENYAVINGGIYSDVEANLLPLLPGGLLLENAFTGIASEPQFGANATSAGQVGIKTIQKAGVNSGYMITGFGKEGEILRMSNGS